MTDKIALVTGASRGLGYACAAALAPEYHVVAVGRTVGGLEDLDDAIKALLGRAVAGHRIGKDPSNCAIPVMEAGLKSGWARPA